MKDFSYNDFKKISMKASELSLEMWYKFNFLTACSKTRFTKKEREMFMDVSAILRCASQKAYKKKIRLEKKNRG